MANVQQGYGHSDVCAEPFDFYVPLTGFSITMQTAKLVLNPAGTLATGTVTLPLNPPDGAVAEISSTQIISALTVSANTGDLIVNGVLAAVTALTPAASATAGSASATIKYKYALFGATPYTVSTGTGANPRTWIRVQ
jgi:hypothetical protein